MSDSSTAPHPEDSKTEEVIRASLCQEGSSDPTHFDLSQTVQESAISTVGGEGAQSTRPRRSSISRHRNRVIQQGTLGRRALEGSAQKDPAQVGSAGTTTSKGRKRVRPASTVALRRTADMHAEPSSSSRGGKIIQPSTSLANSAPDPFATQDRAVSPSVRHRLDTLNLLVGQSTPMSIDSIREIGSKSREQAKSLLLELARSFTKADEIPSSTTRGSLPASRRSMSTIGSLPKVVERTEPPTRAGSPGLSGMGRAFDMSQRQPGEGDETSSGKSAAPEPPSSDDRPQTEFEVVFEGSEPGCIAWRPPSTESESLSHAGEPSIVPSAGDEFPGEGGTQTGGV